MKIEQKKKYKVTIVVPTLNEEVTIGNILKKIKKYSDEIIVIDGHSTDKTKKIALKHKVKFLYDNGSGKGDAVKLGLKIAKYPIVVFIDADGSHIPADIPKLIRPIKENKADLVIGSRMAGGSDELFCDIFEFIRLIGSIIINLIINYRWNVRLSDTQNGFRAILKEVGNHIKLKANDTTIEQEMVMKSLIYGYRVMNIASHEYKRQGGISKIVVSKVWLKYIINVLKYIFIPFYRK